MQSLILKNQFGEESINYVQGDIVAGGTAIPLGDNNVILMQGATAPTSGASGTGVNIAGKGSLYIARDTGALYQQVGAITAPSWSLFEAGDSPLSQVLTGYVQSVGVVSASDTILSAIQKLSGNLALQRVSVGFAALNTAGSGVAVLLGSAIPDNAIIKQVFYEVTETFLDNGTVGDADSSTLSLGLNSQVDAKAAVAISDAADPWDAGIKAGIPVGTAATMIKLTAARQPSVTWTAGTGDATALVAGAMDIFVEYTLGN